MAEKRKELDTLLEGVKSLWSHDDITTEEGLDNLIYKLKYVRQEKDKKKQNHT